MKPYIKNIGEVSLTYSSLGHYVYHLRIEGEPDPFYVGKGVHYRINNHFLPSSLEEPSFKNFKILKASRCGKTVLREIVAYNLTDDEAKKLESEEIERYGRRDIKTGCLTNHTMGGDGISGYNHTKQAKERLREIHSTPEMIELKRKCALSQWDIQARLEMSELMKGRWSTPDFHKRQVESRVGKEQDKQVVDRRAASIRLSYINNPHLKEAASRRALESGLGKSPKTDVQLQSAKNVFASTGSNAGAQAKKSNKMSNYIWITDGTNNRRVSPDQIPEGWSRGRALKEETINKMKSGLQEGWKVGRAGK